MICRYCSGAYAPGEVRCESCGAPKGPVVQTLLDQSSGAMRWMTDYRHAMQLSACGTAVLIVLHILFSPQDASTNSLVILPTFAWMVVAIPAMLGLASIMSAKGKWPTIVMNLLLSVLVWLGNGIAMLIGLLIAY